MSLRGILRHIITALAVLAILPSLRSANAETSPTGKITIIVAFAPRGFADTMALLVAQGLTERLHQNVVVENRAGGGGNIAATFVARAAPDGHRSFGLQPHYLVHGESEIAAWRDHILATPGRYVIEHMGYRQAPRLANVRKLATASILLPKSRLAYRCLVRCNPLIS